MKKSKTASNAQCTQGSTQTTDNDFHKAQLKKANIFIVSMNTKTQHSFTDVGLYHCLVLCDPLFQTSYDPRAKQSSGFWTWHTFVFYFSVEALLWKLRCFKAKLHRLLAMLGWRCRLVCSATLTMTFVLPREFSMFLFYQKNLKVNGCKYLQFYLLKIFDAFPALLLSLYPQLKSIPGCCGCKVGFTSSKKPTEDIHLCITYWAFNTSVSCW